MISRFAVLLSRFAFALLPFAFALPAQGPYYVNGRTGQDAPGNGLSSGTPWKTIGYALQRIPRPPAKQTAYDLLVAGGQIYGPNTNGELLPIVAAYNIAITATGAPAEIEIPVGGTGMRFPASEDFHRDQVAIANFKFCGGSRGIELGAAAGYRHGPRIEHCRFEHQTVTGVHIDTVSQSLDDPRFFDCYFFNQDSAIHGQGTGDGAVLQPEVEDCTFHQCRNDGVFVEDKSSIGAFVGVSVSSCWFIACERNGVHVVNGVKSAATDIRVFSSYFANGSRSTAAIQIVSNRRGDVDAQVESCSLIGGGLSFTGALLPGSHSLTMLRNVAYPTSRAGFTVDVSGTATVRVRSEDNLVMRGPGFVVKTTSAGVKLSMDSLRDRWIGGGSSPIGMYVIGASTSTVVRVVSGMFCRGSDGVYIVGSADVTLSFLTLADNHHGLWDQGTGPRKIDHCIFANNLGFECAVPAGVAITHSCFQNRAFPGPGNLNNTNPQLVRPYYKLAPGSPCIDAGSPTAYALTDYEGNPRIVRGGPDIGAHEYQPTGSAKPYGVRGFGRKRYFPEITSQSARVGYPLKVELVKARDSGSVTAIGAALFAGTAEDSGWVLPFDLVGEGAPGSFLWCNLLASLGPAVVDASGTASITLGVPANPVLVGNAMTLQWLTLMPGANALGVVTTQGLRVTFGL